MAKSEPKATMSEPEMRICIKVRAISTTQLDDGTFSIEIPAQHLSRGELDMLGKLFPSQYDRACELLNVEALIAAIVN